jgi:hypothetical protein
MQAGQPARRRLPNRRASESFVFELEGLRFTATVSRFDDGRVSELFLNNHKHGNQVIAARCSRRRQSRSIYPFWRWPSERSPTSLKCTRQLAPRNHASGGDRKSPLH